LAGEGGSTSFFVKKEAKKLLFDWPVPVKPAVAQIKKSFLLLFYKKEVLFSPYHNLNPADNSAPPA
jgi:hypothetical protein